jgi:hypothetical protein
LIWLKYRVIIAMFWLKYKYVYGSGERKQHRSFRYYKLTTCYGGSNLQFEPGYFARAKTIETNQGCKGVRKKLLLPLPYGSISPFLILAG